MGICGGTFDPVHFGHLRTGLELARAAELGELRFVLAAQPPHRAPPVAPAALRWQMLCAAVAGQPDFAADDRELRRPGPSYTVDTLTELAAELPGRALVLLLGMDAFAGFGDWHRAERILELAHLLVAGRPGWSPPAAGLPARLLAERQTHSPADLRAGAGRVMVHAVTALDISASAIRAGVAAGLDPRFLVPDSVRAMIRTTACYGRDPAPLQRC